MCIWREGALNSKLKDVNFLLQAGNTLFLTRKLSPYHFISWREPLAGGRGRNPRQDILPHSAAQTEGAGSASLP